MSKELYERLKDLRGTIMECLAGPLTDAVLELYEIVATIYSQSRAVANAASCLANGVKPD